MNCEKVNQLMNDFHDGATAAAVKIGMEKHIAGCLSCRDDYDWLRALSDLLQKDVAPVPSAAHDRTLMQAFQAKHAPPAKKSPAWWSGIFAGSLSIPKPAFAAALIAVAVAITTANLIGRNSAMSPGNDMVSPAPAASSSPQISPPEIIERTQIVEVPIIKERVVTKIVYVERENREAQATSSKSAKLNSTQTAALIKKPDNEENSARPNVELSGSVAENGYFTRTNLSDFAPVAEAKIRIIRKGENK